MASRSAQAAVLKAIREGKTNVDLNLPISILMVAMMAMVAALMAAEPLELAAAAARVRTLATQVLPAAIPVRTRAIPTERVTTAMLTSRPWV